VEGGTPSFRRLLKNAGVVIEPLRGLRAYAGYADGYTIPDVGRILRSITQQNVHIDEFLDLQPVVSNNREIGIEWDRGALKASTSYFWSSSKLGALLVRDADGFFHVVRQPVETKGLELSVAWRTPLHDFSVGGAYAHLKGGVDTDDDGRIDADLDGANISPDRLNLFVDWERGPFDARATLRCYFARTFAGQDPRNAFSGYALADAQLSYRFGAHRLSLSVQNLADKQFITYFSDTQLPDDNLRYFAGRGRTFTLGLTSRW
jgi:iron complex outermembrane receptor protein